MKHVLVTGAGGGIGSAIVEALRAQGEAVVEVKRQDADLASYDDIKKLANNMGTFDWLVLAHGYADFNTDFLTQDPENIATTFEVNTTACVYLTQTLLPKLSKGGGIIYISSTAGLSPNGRYAAYSASKAALNTFAQAIARNQPDHTFISVCPGPTNTAMREGLAHDAANQQSPSVVAQVVSSIVEGKSGFVSGDIVVVKNGETSKAAGIA